MNTPLIVVLIIDDDQALRRIVSKVLKDHGHTVIEAPDGEVGLEVVRSVHVDVVLLDINMPGIDGRDVLVRLKSDPLTAPIPVLVFSARDDEYNRPACIALGAEDYIEKPFGSALLEKKLLRLVMSARNRAGK